MENGRLKQEKNNQKYNFIQIPNFKSKTKKDNTYNKINNNYLCQNQTISNKNKDNPLTQSIADKIREMKEELSKDNYTNQKKGNNNFRMRLERISKGNFGTINKENKNNKKFK